MHRDDGDTAAGCGCRGSGERGIAGGDCSRGEDAARRGNGGVSDRDRLRVGRECARQRGGDEDFRREGAAELDPLIVHIGDRAMLEIIAAEVDQDAHRLMEAFWPGPLTLLLPRSARVPDRVTAGLKKVGVRMPAHPAAHALLLAAAVPVAAPSANRFGRTSPTSAAHVLEDLDGRIDAILDGGETTHGVESTVVDVSADECVIYRPGVITLEQIRAVCHGKVWAREGKQGEESQKNRRSLREWRAPLCSQSAADFGGRRGGSAEGGV